ncbi:MAG: M61 family peptidase [Rhodanobacteraceae bacterium]
MKSVCRITTLCAAFALCCAAAANGEPVDQPYPGNLTLKVDLTDAARKIFRVHETIPVQLGKVDLYYPKWIPGEHSPSGPIENVTGLVITGNGHRIAWRRDLADMYTLHLDVPAGVDALDLKFQFLSPTGGGAFGGSVSATSKIVDLEWNQVAFYPAGYYSRDIRIQPSVTLPSGWGFGTALETAGNAGGDISFKLVTFNNLVDSPLIAGRHFKRVDLAPGAKVPVHLDIVADHPGELVITAAQLAAQRNLVTQAYALFGSHHYDHYDFLFTLSDSTGHFGLEHHQSSDDRLFAKYFIDPDTYMAGAGLLPHEYVHSWNGKFRRPADLWTPNFNVPMKDDLLWVYEGLTEYFGPVLTARAGLRDADQFRAGLAMAAAAMDHRPGRSWRDLQDTADAAQVLYYAPRAWASWRRRTDFYVEGELVWLDVDTKIREMSGGKRSLDDFARAFFGIDNGSYKTVTYGFDDIVNALNQIQPNNWTAFLRKRLDTTDPAAPLDGIARGGWKLVYTDAPTALFKANEKVRNYVDLAYSLGITIAGHKDDATGVGTLNDVLWNSPAFAAGLAPGMKIIAVNGEAYDGDLLKAAVLAAKDSTRPIELLVRNGEVFSTIKIDYHDGPRYPRLMRINGTPDRLDAIIRARQ